MPVEQGENDCTTRVKMSAEQGENDCTTRVNVVHPNHNNNNKRTTTQPRGRRVDCLGLYPWILAVMMVYVFVCPSQGILL